MKKQYWTIVFSNSNRPLEPADKSHAECDGMLVYCTMEAAIESMKHQMETYYATMRKSFLKVVPLGEERCCE